MIGAPYYIHEAEVPAPYVGSIQYRNVKGQNQLIDGRKFFDLTGATYITHSFPVYRYLSQVEVDGALYSHRYPEATDCNLRLVHMEGENAFVGLGVVAAKVIECAKAICHYKGQYVPNGQRGPEYKLGEVDAKYYRGLGAMVNHSFPNAKFGFWLHGDFSEHVIVAIEDIPEGEQVCVHYGSKYESVCLGKHAELRYDAARKFVRRDLVDWKQDSDKWRYLACNPSVVLELYWAGDWSWKSINEFLKKDEIFEDLGKLYHDLRNWLTSAIGSSDEALQELRELQPDLYKDIGLFFRQAGRIKSCLGAIYAMKKMAEYMKQEPITKQTWNGMRQKLEPYLFSLDEILLE